MAKARKTRHKKIIADLRRELAAKQESVAVKPKEKPQPQVIPELKHNNFAPSLTLNYSLILSDFKKTLIFTSLAFSFEFSVFWLLEKGGIQLFRW